MYEQIPGSTAHDQRPERTRMGKLVMVMIGHHNLDRVQTPGCRPTRAAASRRVFRLPSPAIPGTLDSLPHRMPKSTMQPRLRTPTPVGTYRRRPLGHGQRQKDGWSIDAWGVLHLVLALEGIKNRGDGSVTRGKDRVGGCLSLVRFSDLARVLINYFHVQFRFHGFPCRTLFASDPRLGIDIPFLTGFHRIAGGRAKRAHPGGAKRLVLRSQTPPPPRSIRAHPRAPEIKPERTTSAV